MDVKGRAQKIHASGFFVMKLDTNDLIVNVPLVPLVRPDCPGVGIILPDPEITF